MLGGVQGHPPGGAGSWRTNRGERKEHREVRSQQSSRKEEVLLG